MRSSALFAGIDLLVLVFILLLTLFKHSMLYHLHLKLCSSLAFMAFFYLRAVPLLLLCKCSPQFISITLCHAFMTCTFTLADNSVASAIIYMFPNLCLQHETFPKLQLPSAYPLIHPHVVTSAGSVCVHPCTAVLLMPVFCSPSPLVSLFISSLKYKPWLCP